jgi:hypothetical protein
MGDRKVGVMPKEITYSNDGPQVRLPDGGNIPAAQADPGHGLPIYQSGVHVGWNRAGWVEVGAAPFCTATGEPSSEPRPGYFLTLDRDGVNRVIRALRKARDQAFGRDE